MPKISELPTPNTDLDGTELVAVVQNGQTVQVPLNTLKTFLNLAVWYGPDEWDIAGLSAIWDGANGWYDWSSGGDLHLTPKAWAIDYRPILAMVELYLPSAGLDTLQLMIDSDGGNVTFAGSTVNDVGGVVGRWCTLAVDLESMTTDLSALRILNPMMATGLRVRNIHFDVASNDQPMML